jgi:hypothetical protein
LSGIVESKNLNLWRICGKYLAVFGEYLSVHEEYDEVRVVCGTQTLNPNMFKYVGPKNPFPNIIGLNPLFKKINTQFDLVKNFCLFLFYFIHVIAIAKNTF